MTKQPSLNSVLITYLGLRPCFHSDLQREGFFCDFGLASTERGVSVLVIIDFVAVVFALASITALQESRAWERRWRNQRKKAAAKAGQSNIGKGGGCLSRCLPPYRRQSSARRLRER